MSVARRLAVDVSDTFTRQATSAYASRNLAEALAAHAPAHGWTVETWQRIGRWKHRAHGMRIDGCRSRWYAAPCWPLIGRPHLLHCAHTRAPWFPGVPMVVTVHDCFEFTNPEWTSPTMVARNTAALRGLASRAARVVCSSDHTRRVLIDHVPALADRAVTVPVCLPESFRAATPAEVTALRARLHLERPYVLFVGSRSRRKNVARLVTAFAASGLSTTHDLVFAGPGGDEESAVITAAADPAQRVRVLDFVPRGDLPALYAGAAALAFATLLEGFGMPILEAQANGCAVLTSDRGSSPEVAGGHAVLCDPTDVAALADGLRRAVAMPAAARDAARAHVEAFRPAAIAARLCAIYAETR